MDAPQLRPFGEQIAEAIARDVIEGRLAAGTRLGEEELAERFGVSRSPVRDALKILDRERFVIAAPRRKVTVGVFDHGSIANIFLLRSRLYGLAAAQQALSGRAEHHETLLRFGRQMLDAAQREDQAAFTRSNADFHDLLFSTCGNPLLQNAVNGIGAIAVVYFRERVRAVPGRILEAAEAHIRAAEAILARDPLAAEPLMSRIITGAGRAIILAEAPERADLLELLDHHLTVR